MLVLLMVIAIPVTVTADESKPMTMLPVIVTLKLRNIQSGVEIYSTLSFPMVSGSV